MSWTSQVSQYQKKHSPTHTYRGHQASLICFLHPSQSMASSLFLHNLCPSFLWSTSCSGTLHFIFHTFLHQLLSSFCSIYPYHCNLSCSTHTYTIVLLLYWILSGTTQVNRYQKGKPIWIYWSKRQWVAVASAGPYATLYQTQDKIFWWGFLRPLLCLMPPYLHHWVHGQCMSIVDATVIWQIALVMKLELCVW